MRGPAGYLAIIGMTSAPVMLSIRAQGGHRYDVKAAEGYGGVTFWVEDAGTVVAGFRPARAR